MMTHEEKIAHSREKMGKKVEKRKKMHDNANKSLFRVFGMRDFARERNEERWRPKQV